MYGKRIALAEQQAHQLRPLGRRRLDHVHIRVEPVLRVLHVPPESDVPADMDVPAGLFRPPEQEVLEVIAEDLVRIRLGHLLLREHPGAGIGNDLAAVDHAKGGLHRGVR